MLSVLLIFCTATTLHFRPTGGAGVSTGRDCVVEAHFTSPYINAYFERLALVTGCVSTENNSQSQEVHVISLIGGHHSKSTDSEPAEVTLHIRPHSNTGIHRAPLIFVLNSHHPVRWIIQAERISNQTRNKFIVNGQKSKVVKDPSISIKTKKVELPLDTDGLAAWTRKNYRAITSFAEVEQANTFLKKVGKNDAAPPACNISANFFDPSSTAAYLQPQPMAGCAVTANEARNDRDVHIIELESGNMNPHNQQEADIFLDIKTKSKSSKSSNRRVALILKSHNPIRWHIRTKGVRNLEVMTDQPAEMVKSSRPRPQSVGMTRDNFGQHTGQDLIGRVRIVQGPIVSYTNMRLANRIDLFLDGARDFHQQSGHTSRGQDLLLKSPFDNPSRTRKVLDRAKIVICNDHGITVLFKKAQMRLAAIRQEHLSLKNKSCVATSNDTHYILHTFRDKCSTMEPSESILANSILVNRIDESRLDLEDEGSAISADMLEASGFDLDDTHIDDEDFSNTAVSNTAIELPFECQRHLINSLTDEPVLYYLESYRDDKMTQRYTCPCFMNDLDTIYIKATLKREFRDVLQPRIHTCWVSEYSDKAQESENLLISRGCPHDEGVQWIASDAAFSVNFLKLSKKISHGHVYIHCKMTVCSNNSPEVTGLSMCQSHANYCQYPQELKHVETKTVGPVRFINFPHEPTNAPAQTFNGEGCQVSTIEGLDAATVVGIAFATFIIGVLLTAALWFIHTHTGPRRKQNRPRSTETSGESTPSSTAPITIRQIHT